MLSITACECNEEGSTDISCNEDGKCSCKPNINGEKCDACKDGHSDFPNCQECSEEFFGSPNCQACDCNPEGSTDNSCDSVSGQCNCKPRIVGRACDESEPGFYDFPDPKGDVIFNADSLDR